MAGGEEVRLGSEGGGGGLGMGGGASPGASRLKVPFVGAARLPPQRPRHTDLYSVRRLGRAERISGSGNVLRQPPLILQRSPASCLETERISAELQVRDLVETGRKTLTVSYWKEKRKR